MFYLPTFQHPQYKPTACFHIPQVLETAWIYIKPYLKVEWLGFKSENHNSLCLQLNYQGQPSFQRCLKTEDGNYLSEPHS